MNNNFDEIIRSKILKETVILPESLNDRIKTTVQNLPEDEPVINNFKRSKSSIRIILIASILSLFLMSTAFGAIPKILEMTHNLIKQFSQVDDINLKSKQEAFEKFNAPTDLTCEIDGVSVTINSISADENFIMITTTINSTEPIEDIVKEHTMYKEFAARFDMEDLSLFLSELAPHYLFKVENKDYVKIFDLVDDEEYIQDKYTLVSIQKYMIPDVLPDVYKLTFYENKICYVEGDWAFNTFIDKTNTKDETITVTPNIHAEVTSILCGEEIKHDISIDKVSISPFGGQIVISEAGENNFSEFVLRDKDKNYYSVIINSVTGDSENRMVSNSFEIICPSGTEKLDELTLIPVMTDSRTEVKEIYIQEGKIPTKIEISDIGGYTIESFEADNEKYSLKLKPYGALLGNRNLTNGGFGLLDKNNSKEIGRYISSGPGKYDKDNDYMILTGYWTDEAPENICEQIGGFYHIQIPYMEMNEHEAIIIPLK